MLEGTQGGEDGVGDEGLRPRRWLSAAGSPKAALGGVFGEPSVGEQPGGGVGHSRPTVGSGGWGGVGG